MKRIRINGDIVTNDYKWIYDWFGMDSTCPKDIDAVIDAAEPGEEIVVQINSPGGIVDAGMEIYSMLHNRENVIIEITGIAGSAAGIISQAGYVKMHPVSMIMIHNVSGGASGDYHVMEKTSQTLKDIGNAMASAYAAKSGKPIKDIVKMMDEETWITAEKAIEYGFADEIIGGSNAAGTVTNSMGLSITMDMITQARRERDARNKERELLELSMSIYGE